MTDSTPAKTKPTCPRPGTDAPGCRECAGAGAFSQKRRVVIQQQHQVAPGAASQGSSLSTGVGAVIVKSSLVVLRDLDVLLVLLPRPWPCRSGRPRSATRSGRVRGYCSGSSLSSTGAGSPGRELPATQLGLNLFEAFGRIWLLAGAIMLAGVAGGRADGLTAALVIFAAYSVAFAIRVLSGKPTSPAGRQVAR